MRAVCSAAIVFRSNTFLFSLLVGVVSAILHAVLYKPLSSPESPSLVVCTAIQLRVWEMSPSFAAADCVYDDLHVSLFSQNATLPGRGSLPVSRELVVLAILRLSSVVPMLIAATGIASV